MVFRLMFHYSKPIIFLIVIVLFGTTPVICQAYQSNDQKAYLSDEQAKTNSSKPTYEKSNSLLIDREGNLNEIKQNTHNDFSDNTVTRVLSLLYLLIGLHLLTLTAFIFFWFSKKNQKIKNVAKPIEPLAWERVDHYLEEIIARLDRLKSSSEIETTSSSNKNITPVNDLSKFLKTNISTSNDWASFEQYFEKIHKDFFKNLKTIYPNITTNEMNMCALIKLNIRNKDIAQIMGISYDSVRKSQSRLSKKMEVPKNGNLRDHILLI